ncbi:TlpA family protein disulfide reductase [Streptacidiphilus sp. PAMC 29251]
MGERPAPFSVVATNGATVDRDTLQAPVLVSAFATSCPDCARHAPELLDRAAQWSDAGIDRLSLLVDTGPDRKGLAEILGRAGNLVTGDQAAALMRVLRVPSTPAYLLLDTDGSVLATGSELDALPLPVR